MDHTGKDVPQGFTSDQGPPPSLLDTMKDEGVWTRDSLSPDDWVVPLPEAKEKYIYSHERFVGTRIEMVQNSILSLHQLLSVKILKDM